MSRLPIVLSIGLFLSFTTAPAPAHHATAVEYDVSKTVTFRGVISKLQWTNPHVHVQVEVKGEHDGIEMWNVEFASPGGVIVAGLSKDLLKSGTTITIKGYPSKVAVSEDHSTRRPACATEVHFENGITAKFVVGI